MNNIPKRKTPIAIAALLDRKIRGVATKSNMHFINETVRIQSKATAIDFANFIFNEHYIASPAGWIKQGPEAYNTLSTHELYLKFLQNE